MVRSQMRHDAFCVQGAWVSLWINGAVWWWPPSVPAREKHQAMVDRYWCRQAMVFGFVLTVCYQLLSCSINGTPKKCKGAPGARPRLGLGPLGQLGMPNEDRLGRCRNWWVSAARWAETVDPKLTVKTSFIIYHHFSSFFIIFHIVLTGHDLNRCRSRSPQRQPSPPVSVGPRCKSFIEN
jgi:hypothetical protein